MAERRMFSKTIVDSDAFLDLPLSAQTLYFHLSMRADDDGFLNNARKIQRMIGASDDDMTVLISEGYIIRFDSGVVAIKDWKINNYIRSDRYKPTVFKEEKAMLSALEKNANDGEASKPENSRACSVPDDTDDSKECAEPCESEEKTTDSAEEKHSDTKGIPMVDQRYTQCSVGKCRLGKVSLGKDRCVNNNNNIITKEPGGAEKHPHNTHITLSVYDSLCSKYGKAFVDSKADKAYNDKALIKFCEQDYKRKPSSGAGKNKFNKFEQRDYDLNALEERLTSIPPPTAGNN